MFSRMTTTTCIAYSALAELLLGDISWLALGKTFLEANLSILGTPR